MSNGIFQVSHILRFGLWLLFDLSYIHCTTDLIYESNKMQIFLLFIAVLVEKAGHSFFVWSKFWCKKKITIFDIVLWCTSTVQLINLWIEQNAKIASFYHNFFVKKSKSSKISFFIVNFEIKTQFFLCGSGGLTSTNYMLQLKPDTSFWYTSTVQLIRFMNRTKCKNSFFLSQFSFFNVNS